MARRRGAGALVGGAACARLSGWSRHLALADNPGEAWQFGTRGILGWLLGPLLAFVAIGFAGYARGRRAGSAASACCATPALAYLAVVGLPVVVALGVSVIRLAG